MKALTTTQYVSSAILFTILSGTVTAGDAIVTDNAKPNARQAPVDFANAKPMPLPASSLAPSDMQTVLNMGNNDSEQGEPGFSKGKKGSGELSPLRLPKSNNDIGQQTEGDLDDINNQEYGTARHPYTTSRVDAYGLRLSRYYPYRATGKLFFKKGSASYVCSASLIKPGVVVTAAHCLADYGKKKFYGSFTYVPAYYNGQAPYGSWSGFGATIMSSYYSGTSGHCLSGVVCDNDIGVLKIRKQTISGRSRFAGHLTGWLSYAWNGWGSTYNGTFRQTLTHITQLGYPVSHDRGAKMQRNDSVGYKNSGYKNNTIIGSRLTGGSSGGPWVNNFGQMSSLSGTSKGAYSYNNVVVGVTSWGYTSSGPKVQGASPFTSGNIKRLMSSACPSSSSYGCR
jgi:V8-like Glu-specific endopeptidase